ncbi:MAG: YjjW family glycine radical enzyme activase [Propionibacteriales bacterium]|nr:YjjW family glycine radical enzyme activase [Propionibacteriales bacterium]
MVTDIIEFSVVDGPGNRFVVFLQGCNFDCLACHNPYTITPCIDCGICLDACATGALSMVSDRVVWNESLCTGTDACIAACPYDSTPKARPQAVAELMTRIRRTAGFISGVTVSGGEATQQAGFVHALFTAVKAEFPGLTCFVDSNGAADVAVWDGLDDVMDAAMIDLKCLDDEVHVRLTGKSNAQVLATIELLAARGKLHEVRLLLMAGLNDSDELLAETGRWLAAIDPAMRIKVIGYRAHGVRPSAVPLVEPTAAQREHYADVLRAEGRFDLQVI